MTDAKTPFQHAADFLHLALIALAAVAVGTAVITLAPLIVVGAGVIGVLGFAHDLKRGYRL